MNAAKDTTSRRTFLKDGGRIAGVSTLAGITLPYVHAAENNTSQLALVGCGGRGTGAVENALGIKNGPIKLVAMADMFPQKLSDSHGRLRGRFVSQMDVPQERQFIGFDAFAKAMDCFKPGDVVVLGTPTAFRWVHLRYAIDKGQHVFLDKPVAVDGPTTRRMIALGEEAGRKNLKVGVGLMVRHCRARQELLSRIRDGQIGDVVAMRGYRMAPASGTAPVKPEGITEQRSELRSGKCKAAPNPFGLCRGQGKVADLECRVRAHRSSCIGRIFLSPPPPPPPRVPCCCTITPANDGVIARRFWNGPAVDSAESFGP
jgi:hypothetical protein